MDRVKGVDEPIRTKDIFDFIYPSGYMINPYYNADFAVTEDDADDAISSITGGSPRKRATEYPYHVLCSKCGKSTGSYKVTQYGNPVDHAMRKCFDRDAVNKAIIELRSEHSKGRGGKTKQAELLQFLPNHSHPTDIALHHWMQLVTIYNLPIHRLRDPNFCKLLVCNKNSPCYQTFVDTMLELSFIVEEKIAAEIKGKKGTIMHDGWSKYARHYICLLASYLIPNGKRDSEGQDIMEPVMTLLTCTTLPHDDDDEANVGTEDDETTRAQLAATKVNAETHVRLFKQTFENLGVGDMSNFVIGQVADSTALNPKIAKLLKFQHIACRNHCLNLGCKDMESKCGDLQRLADKTQECHRKIKASNKLTASFENIQASSRALTAGRESAQKLKLRAATRWNSLTAMLEGHLKSAETIHQLMRENEDRDLDEETVGRTFLNDVRKHLPYLQLIQSASIRMQKRHATLDDCQFQCDTIAEFHAAGYGKRGDIFQLCEYVPVCPS